MGASSLGAENANCPPKEGPMDLTATGRKLDIGFKGGIGRERGLPNAEPILVTSATGFDRDTGMTDDEVDVYKQRG